MFEEKSFSSQTPNSDNILRLWVSMLISDMIRSGFRSVRILQA